jgi:hypothetical protein
MAATTHASASGHVIGSDATAPTTIPHVTASRQLGAVRLAAMVN